MNFLKSIKWRLQLWYGLILVLVLAGFGLTAYQLERGRVFGRINQELHRRVEVLGRVLHRPPPRGPDFEAPPFDGPPPEPFSNDDQPEQNLRRPAGFVLPPEDAHFFGPGDPNGFYFIIQSHDGKEIARSTNQPNSAFPPAAVKTVNPNPPSDSSPPKAVFSGNDCELGTRLPSGEMIWVGCSLVQEQKELRHTAFNLTMAGGLILLVGLAGGWWMVTRSLRPIQAISTAAVKISAGDLSQRINVAETESELGQLAAVLNATFARLETAFAQQQQFTADAAHELRTPVSVILTQTQMALNRERSAGDYRQTVEACQRAAQRMRKLIESLLQLARFDAGQEVLKQLRFDLAHTIADSAELVQPLAAERGVRFLIEAEPLAITGDGERMAQVVTNLLTNAIQYNRPNGEVRVKLAAQSGLAVLTVADTGAGMTAEVLPRVFERFYRADKSRTGSGNSGLGLSICKAIVEAHGGTIEVMSQNNTGTIFTVRLPIN